jgi:hypothetical protein
MQPELDSLQGWAVVAAALVATTVLLGTSSFGVQLREERARQPVSPLCPRDGGRTESSSTLTVDYA